MGTVGPGAAVVGVESYLGDVSLAYLSLGGGDVLLGPMPLLLEVSPLVTAVDMLVQCCQLQNRARVDREIKIHKHHSME